MLAADWTQLQALRAPSSGLQTKKDKLRFGHRTQRAGTDTVRTGATVVIVPTYPTPKAGPLLSIFEDGKQS